MFLSSIEVLSFIYLCASVNLVMLDAHCKDWNAGLSNMPHFGSGMANHVKLQYQYICWVFWSHRLAKTMDKPICANIFSYWIQNCCIFIFQFKNLGIFASKKVSLLVSCLSLVHWFMRWEIESTFKTVYLVFIGNSVLWLNILNLSVIFDKRWSKSLSFRRNYITFFVYEF